jgi:nicotinamide-nucleotide adenylyltransferase
MDMFINAKMLSIKMKIGIFIGRFQPFHTAHLSDIKNMLTQVDILQIGIGSSQEKGTDTNPLSFIERKEMISRALNEANIRRCRFFPIQDVGDDELWVSEIERKLHIRNRRSEVMVFSGNDWTLECFKKKGYSTKKIALIEGISGTIIRGLMKEKKEWSHLVPPSVSLYFKVREASDISTEKNDKKQRKGKTIRKSP